VLIATDRFRSALKAMARIGGAEDTRWAEVPHPIASLSADELEDRARKTVDQFESIVLKR
jgi:hypothetical protein